MCRSYRMVAQVHTRHDGLLPPSPITCIRHFFQCYPSPTSPPPAIAPLAHSVPNRPHCVMFPSLCPYVLIVQHLPMIENMQCLIFCSCLSLLRMMVSRFIHVPTKDRNSLFFMAAYYSMLYMFHIFLVQSIINGHLGWFKVFAIVNSAAMNIHVHVSL